MLRDGIAERRRRVDDPAVAGEAPVFEELHAAGMTEWLGHVFPLGELMPKIGGQREARHAQRLGLLLFGPTPPPRRHSDSRTGVLETALPPSPLPVRAPSPSPAPP